VWETIKAGILYMIGPEELPEAKVSKLNSWSNPVFQKEKKDVLKISFWFKAYQSCFIFWSFDNNQI